MYRGRCNGRRSSPKALRRRSGDTRAPPGHDTDGTPRSLALPPLPRSPFFAKWGTHDLSTRPDTGPGSRLRHPGTRSRMSVTAPQGRGRFAIQACPRHGVPKETRPAADTASISIDRCTENALDRTPFDTLRHTQPDRRVDTPAELWRRVRYHFDYSRSTHTGSPHAPSRSRPKRASAQKK